MPDDAVAGTGDRVQVGYLPGSDKRIQTEPESTLSALRAASELLKPDGLLLVVAYRGHDVFYRREGRGDALVLIHGFPTASWDWVLLEELPEPLQAPILAIDLTERKEAEAALRRGLNRCPEVSKSSSSKEHNSSRKSARRRGLEYGITFFL